MECFDNWQTQHAGLFTVAQSQKHIGLYQRFAFYPRFLTAIMSKTVGATGRASTWTKFSDTPANEQAAIVDACRELTEAIYEGLESGVKFAPLPSKLGDTVLLWMAAG